MRSRFKDGEVKFVPESITRNVCRQILIMKKNSPHIFFGVGIVGAIASTVLACRATLKLEETLDEIKHDVDSVKKLKEPKTYSNDYPVEEYNRDAVYVYAKGTFKLVRLYAPAVVVGSVSIACLTGSHVQLTRRNNALMAAYAILEKAYSDYRDRVREVVGESKELELYHGAQIEKVNKEEVKVIDPNRWSPYAKFFDEGSIHWCKDPEINRLYIQCQQNYANNLLRARGHVFLNEVYDMLDVERSSAGQVVGWVMGGDGDNYISFGIFDVYNKPFINGWEATILLDFNVDGVVYDKI